MCAWTKSAHCTPGLRALEATMETFVGKTDFLAMTLVAWKLALLKIAQKRSIKYVSFPHHQDALLEICAPQSQ